MDVDLSDGAVVVTLSERNLAQLVEAQEQLKGLQPVLQRMTADGFLVVKVESDAEHYKGRTPGPGLEPFLARTSDPGSEED